MRSRIFAVATALGLLGVAYLAGAPWRPRPGGRDGRPQAGVESTSPAPAAEATPAPPPDFTYVGKVPAGNSWTTEVEVFCERSTGNRLYVLNGTEKAKAAIAVVEGGCR